MSSKIMKLKSILMKPCISLKSFLIIFLFLLWIPKTFALAGFAENSSTLHYNNLADISWGHPSDACQGHYPYGQYCFYLIEKNNLSSPFQSSLQEITVPNDPDFPFVLMKSTKDYWMVYDLKEQGVMLESDDFESAFKKWEELGLPKMKFANSTDLSNFFQETEESKATNRMKWSEFFLLLFGLVFYLHWKFWLGMSIVLLCYAFLSKRYHHFNV